jgi:hypothetical protein
MGGSITWEPLILKILCHCVHVFVKRRSLAHLLNKELTLPEKGRNKL